jgi:hypothetical protein
LRAVAGAVIEVGVAGERRGGGSQAFAERGELAAAVVAVAQAQVVGQRGQRQAAEGIVGIRGRVYKKYSSTTLVSHLQKYYTKAQISLCVFASFATI